MLPPRHAHAHSLGSRKRSCRVAFIGIGKAPVFRWAARRNGGSLEGAEGRAWGGETRVPRDGGRAAAAGEGEARGKRRVTNKSTFGRVTTEEERAAAAAVARQRHPPFKHPAHIPENTVPIRRPRGRPRTMLDPSLEQSYELWKALAEHQRSLKRAEERALRDIQRELSPDKGSAKPHPAMPAGRLAVPRAGGDQSVSDGRRLRWAEAAARAEKLLHAYVGEAHTTPELVSIVRSYEPESCEAMLAFLRDDLGMSKDDLAEMATTRSSLLGHGASVPRLRAAATRLRDEEGLADDELRALVRKKSIKLLMDVANTTNFPQDAALSHTMNQYDESSDVKVYNDMMDERKDEVKRFFVDEMGMKEEQFARMMTTFPTVASLDVDSILRPKVRFLGEAIGFTERQLRKVVMTNPFMLGLRIERVKDSLDFFHSCNITGRELASMLHIQPMLLNLDRDMNLEMKRRFFLEELGVSPRTFRTLLLYKPQTMMPSIDTLREKVNFYVTEFGVPLDILARRISVVPLAYSQETLRKKAKFFMDELGWSEKVFRKAVCNYPAILGYSIEGNIKHTFEYMEEELGMKREAVAELLANHPHVFGYSLEHKLRPTVRYLMKMYPNCTVQQAVAASKHSFEKRLKPRSELLHKLDLLWRYSPRYIASMSVHEFDHKFGFIDADAETVYVDGEEEVAAAAGEFIETAKDAARYLRAPR